MNSVSDNAVKRSWKLGLWWVLATIGGLLLGLVLMFAGIGALINNAPLLIFGLVFGGVLGLGCDTAAFAGLGRKIAVSLSTQRRVEPGQMQF
ncbi:MAG: hypothetical protein WAM60_03025 [Candidatus Promineifilaceae bacterium]